MAMQRKRRRRPGGNTNTQNNNPNRHYESNGPDVRIRGSAQQILEKYLQYARDAHTSGDRIKAEGLFQHAEHYARIVASFEKQKEEERRDREERDARRAEEQALRQPPEEDEVSRESEPAEDATPEEAQAPDEAPRRRGRRPRAAAPEVDQGDMSRRDPDGTSEETADDARADTVSSDEKPRRRRRTYTPREAAAAEDDGVLKTLSRGADEADGLGQTEDAS